MPVGLPSLFYGARENHDRSFSRSRAAAQRVQRAGKRCPGKPDPTRGASLAAQVLARLHRRAGDLRLVDQDIEGRAIGAFLHLVGIGAGSGPGSGRGPGGAGGIGSGSGLGGVAACCGGTFTSSGLGSGISSGSRSGSGSSMGFGSVSGTGGKSGGGLGTSGSGLRGSGIARSPFGTTNCNPVTLVPGGLKSTGEGREAQNLPSATNSGVNNASISCSTELISNPASRLDVPGQKQREAERVREIFSMTANHKELRSRRAPTGYSRRCCRCRRRMRDRIVSILRSDCRLRARR